PIIIAPEKRACKRILRAAPETEERPAERPGALALFALYEVDELIFRRLGGRDGLGDEPRPNALVDVVAAQLDARGDVHPRAVAELLGVLPLADEADERDVLGAARQAEAPGDERVAVHLVGLADVRLQAHGLAFVFLH